MLATKALEKHVLAGSTKDIRRGSRFVGTISLRSNFCATTVKLLRKKKARLLLFLHHLQMEAKRDNSDMTHFRHCRYDRIQLTFQPPIQAVQSKKGYLFDLPCGSFSTDIARMATYAFHPLAKTRRSESRPLPLDVGRVINSKLLKHRSHAVNSGKGHRPIPYLRTSSTHRIDPNHLGLRPDDACQIGTVC